MKEGKLRTMSICLSDLPKDKMTKAGNGKIYINLTTWDNDEPDKYDNDFSVQVSKSKEEREAKAATVYVGNGRIWPTGGQPITDEEGDDLPF